MPDGRVHLAIDLGAESGRVIAGILDGDRLTLHEMHRFANTPRHMPTGLHWDVLGLFGEIIESLRRSVVWTQAMRLRLVSLGVDAWGVDYALLSASGELLGLPHCYRDEGFAAACDDAVARLGAASLYETTGIQLMPINTLFQLVARHRRDPGLVERAERLLLIPDLVHYLLTGEAVVESTIASTTHMLDARTGRWDPSLLERLGVPHAMLGPIVAPGTVLGPLRGELAGETGHDEALRVIAPAAHDTAAAIAAVPADPDTSWCYLSSGTWSLLGAELDEPCLSDAARRVSFTNERGIGGTVRFLKNITGLWLVQEIRRAFAGIGADHDYEALTAFAESAAPFRTLLDTEHEPFARRGDMPARVDEYARATRQPVPEGIGAYVRCCLESLALAYRHTLALLEQTLGGRFEVIHVVGGGARNPLLNQMTADATGRRVAAGPAEATATGNVLVQAMGDGTVADPAHIRRIVAETYPPRIFEPRDTGPWDQAYDRFRELIARREG